jgi:outer membrane protein
MESAMKKCFFFATIAVLILFVHGMVLGQGATKVGLIDLQRCLQESKEGERATTVLKKKKAALQKELDSKQQELFDLRREFEKQAMMLSMDAQEDKRKAVERKARELEYYFQDLNEEMKRAEEKEKKRIFEELGKVVEKIGAEGNYAMILEQRSGGVLYWNRAIDITDEVIRAYDKVIEEQGKKTGK